MPFVIVEIDGLQHEFSSATGFSEISGTVSLTRKFKPANLDMADWYESAESGTAEQKDISILLRGVDVDGVERAVESGRRNLFRCLPCAYEVSDPGAEQQTESISLTYEDAQWG